MPPAFAWGRFSEKAKASIEGSDARINVWHGAVRSGKTVASVTRWLGFVTEAPRGGNLLMVGKTERTVRDNILGPIQEMLGAGRCVYKRGAGEAYIGGRRIIVRGANDEGAEAKIRGLTLSGVYGDELTLWPESFFKRCLDRLSVRGAKFFGTTNPDSPYHWLKRDYLDREDELDLKSFHFALADNPNLDPAYVAALEKEFAGLWYKRFVLGSWVIAEGAVYDQFDQDVHVVSELPPAFEKVVVSVDYGTANATVFLLLGRSGDTWYVAREYYYDSREAGRQKTDAEYSADLRDFVGNCHLQSIEVDPSAASFMAQLRRDGFRPVRGADHDVLDGIRVTSKAFTAGRLKIHESCERLIGELTGYTWDPRAQERGEDRPLKVADHAPDALRYGCVRIFGRPALRVLKKPAGA